MIKPLLFALFPTILSAQTLTVGQQLPAAGAAAVPAGATVLIPAGLVCTVQLTLAQGVTVRNAGNWAPALLSVPALASVVNTGRLNAALISVEKDGTLQNEGFVEVLYARSVGSLHNRPGGTFRCTGRVALAGDARNCGTWQVRETSGVLANVCVP